MECPECRGLRAIKLPGPYAWMSCPTCEGEGELPDAPATNWCPACGEPIPASEQWCQFHSAAAHLNSMANFDDGLVGE